MNTSSTRRLATPQLWGEEVFIGKTTERYKMLIWVFVTLVLFSFCNNIFAEPYLQLDAYLAVSAVDYEESIVSEQLDFTFYPLFNGNSGRMKGKPKDDCDVDNPFNNLAALLLKDTQTDSPFDLGLIFLDGVPILAVTDMLYGTLPVPKYDVLDTYYYDRAFTLGPAGITALCNAQGKLSGPATVVGDGSLYIEDFQIDVSGLVRGLAVYLDFFAQKSDDTLVCFALLP
jgi:hypothetical protein